MKSVTYTGPYDEVSLADPETGESIPCKKGEAVKVSDELAAGLVDQEDAWKVTTARKSESSDSDKKKEE